MSGYPQPNVLAVLVEDAHYVATTPQDEVKSAAYAIPGPFAWCTP
jgi:hypothetical protein